MMMSLRFVSSRRGQLPRGRVVLETCKKNAGETTESEQVHTNCKLQKRENESNLFLG